MIVYIAQHDFRDECRCPNCKYIARVIEEDGEADKLLPES